ncbi:hypothetical protein ACFLRB_03820, partial [Acidobacteriota bacterium]
MLQKKVIIVVVLGILITIIPGCKKSEIVPGVPEGLLISHTDCKGDKLSQSSIANKSATATVRKCLVF